MHRQLTPITALVLTSLMLGCAGTKDAVLPRDGPSIQAIYARHALKTGMHEAGTPCPECQDCPIADGDEALDGCSRNARVAIDAVFPRLANPDLVMYVFPHLAGPERVPVPGYATTFPMYERVEYALPGEGPVRPAHE